MFQLDLVCALICPEMRPQCALTAQVDEDAFSDSSLICEIVTAFNICKMLSFTRRNGSRTVQVGPARNPHAS